MRDCISVSQDIWDYRYDCSGFGYGSYAISEISDSWFLSKRNQSVCRLFLVFAEFGNQLLYVCIQGMPADCRSAAGHGSEYENGC